MRLPGATCFLIVFLFIACNRKKAGGLVCTQEARAGLTVTVSDVLSGKALGDSVMVSAQSVAGSFTLDYLPSTAPSFAGAWEQSGTFTVTVVHPRYKPYTSEPVTVERDECHVIPQLLTVKLSPK